MQEAGSRVSPGSNGALRDALTLCLQVFDTPPRELAFLKNLNNTEDPFAWTAARWNMRGLREVYGVELIALAVLTGLVTILSLSALRLQFRARSQQPKVFWLFRRHFHNNSKIPYIVPHPVNLALSATLLTSLELLVYLGFSYDVWNRNLNARAIRVASWFPAIWLPFFAAVWMSGFGSMYLTFLAPAQFTRRGSLTGIKRRISPLLINVFCFGVPTLAFGTILPLQALQARRMPVAMKKIFSLTRTLHALSSDWQMSASITDTRIDGLLNQAQNAQGAVQEWRMFWAAEMGAWSFFTILAMAVAVPLCASLVLSMNRRIRRMAAIQGQLPTMTDIAWTKSTESIPPLQPLTITIPPPASTTLFSESSFTRSPASISFSTTAFSDPSTPNSAVQTPSAKESLFQPFFPSPALSSASLLSNKTEKDQQQGRPHLSQKHNFQHIRRISQYAIFPGSSGPDLNDQSRGDLQELNRRYWHVISQYATVFMVMAFICAFALYEASSDIDILSDCRRTNIAVLVVGFIFCILVNVWLCLTIYRLLTGTSSSSGKDSPLHEISPRHSQASSLSAYTLSKQPSPHHRDILQLRKTPSPPTLPPQHLNEGLRIEIDTALSTTRRPSFAAEGRRRSRSRVRQSLDFAAALHLPFDEEDDDGEQLAPPRSHVRRVSFA